MYDGGYDAFVAKVRPDGRGLTYAGYIGGGSDEQAFGVALDASGAVYVAGLTFSNSIPESSGGDGFPATGGPNTNYAGNEDAFVVKLVDPTATPTPTDARVHADPHGHGDPHDAPGLSLGG